MCIDELIKKALDGDKPALEAVAGGIQDNIYNLALRILVDPELAMDATQEILIKVITSLSTFRFESRFETWVYRVAANYLVSEKRLQRRAPEMTFDLYKNDLESDLKDPSEWEFAPDYQVLLNELRISCTMAMLLCLNLPHRMAYIFGEILQFEHGEASDILSISKANFRKQLSRARTEVLEFTQVACGLSNPNANCSCEGKLTGAIDRGRVKPATLFFASDKQLDYEKLKQSLKETQQGLRAASIHRSIQRYKSPLALSRVIEDLVSEATKHQFRPVLHGSELKTSSQKS